MNHEGKCAYWRGDQCDCIVGDEERESLLVARASRPSPAELIRRAKSMGLIAKAFDYQSNS